MPGPCRGRDEVAERGPRDLQCPARVFDVLHGEHPSPGAIALTKLLRAAQPFELATKQRPLQRPTAGRDRPARSSAPRASATDRLAAPKAGGWPCPDCRLPP